MNETQISADLIVPGNPGENIGVGQKATYKTAYTLLDFEANDLINLAAAEAILSYSVMIPIPSGSPIPLVVDMTNPLYARVSPWFIAQVEILNAGEATATEATPIFDVPVKKIFTDDTRTVLSGLNIYGHPDPANGAITIDELQLIIR